MARRRMKLDDATACEILQQAGGVGADSHALPSSKVDVILEAADRFGYRKPKSANGSRGRYFHAFLNRLCNPVGKHTQPSAFQLQSLRRHWSR